MSLLDLVEIINPWLYLRVSKAAGGLSKFGDKLIPIGRMEDLRWEYSTLKDECLAMHLPASVATLEQLVELLSDPKSPPTAKKLHGLLEELHGRFIDETKDRWFVALSMKEGELLASPRTKWETTIEKFPAAVGDIEEAGRCQAFHRHTACVFHLMRVMEIGLRSLGKSLKDPNLNPRSNPSWEAILYKCNKELEKPRQQRSPKWRTNDTFYSNAIANLRVVKDAWRNPTLHIERTYGEEEAQEVYNAVRAFMRHLATKLRG